MEKVGVGIVVCGEAPESDDEENELANQFTLTSLNEQDCQKVSTDSSATCEKELQGGREKKIGAYKEDAACQKLRENNLRLKTSVVAMVEQRHHDVINEITEVNQCMSRSINLAERTAGALKYLCKDLAAVNNLIIETLPPLNTPTINTPTINAPTINTPSS